MAFRRVNEQTLAEVGERLAVSLEVGVGAQIPLLVVDQKHNNHRVKAYRPRAQHRHFPFVVDDARGAQKFLRTEKKTKKELSISISGGPSLSACTNIQQLSVQLKRYGEYETKPKYKIDLVSPFRCTEIARRYNVLITPFQHQT